MDNDFFKEKEFRPGSMGAAEAKNAKIFRIVAGVIYVIILAILFLIPNYQNSMQERAGALNGIIGFIMILISYFCLYYFNAIADRLGGWGWSLLLVVAFLLGGWQMAIGFNGDLTFR